MRFRFRTFVTVVMLATSFKLCTTRICFWALVIAAYHVGLAASFTFCTRAMHVSDASAYNIGLDDCFDWPAARCCLTIQAVDTLIFKSGLVSAHGNSHDCFAAFKTHLHIYHNENTRICHLHAPQHNTCGRMSAIRLHMDSESLAWCHYRGIHTICAVSTLRTIVESL